MRAEVYWITGVRPGRLAILPRPRGGDWLEDEIAALRREGVDCLVSMLTREEIEELALDEEASVCERNNIRFLTFPVNDRSVPASLKQTGTLTQQLVVLVEEGKSVAIHCRQGVGRSALLAACVLATWESADSAFERITTARGCPVPDTSEQRQWVALFLRERSS